MVDTPPSRNGGVFSGLFRLLWARPTILLAGLAIGVVLGLNLAPDATAPSPTAGAPPVAAEAKAPGTASAATLANAPRATVASASLVVPSDIQPQFVRAPGAGGPITVGVFGDSLGDGVWAALYRELQDNKAIKVVRLSQVSTGLSRYNYVDVQAKTVGQLATQHIDIAVFMFGANDQQGIVDGGAIYPFGTEGWKAAYGRRVDNLVATLRREGATIYWLGLPKMEREHFDQGAVLINTVLQQHMAADGVTFVPTAPLTVDAQGQYAAYLAGPGGTKKLMRANDGIHMSMAGYLRIAEPVAILIKRSTATATAPVTQPAVAAAAVRLPDGPADSNP